MCGITGIFRPAGLRDDDRACLPRMTQQLAHRGPDDQTLHIEGPIGLGHRRLAVIDPAGGRQPFWSEDRGIVCVFNGEIYNHHDVRRELAAAGHTFTTRCDAEVLPHAYEQWGPDFPSHLLGMFAIALFDTHRRRLVLVRDRLGVKPLYWAQSGSALLFGSELKALLHGPGDAPGTLLPRRPDIQAMHGCLVYRTVPGRATGFAGIYSLAPAGVMTFESAGPSGHLRRRTSHYWSLPLPRRTSRRDAQQLADERVAQATRDRLESDVPLGAFLSGGVDSAVVVAQMRRAMAEVTAFTIGFTQTEFDETADARAAAAHLAVQQRLKEVAPDAASLLPRLVWAADEPYADSSLLPTYLLCRWAREHFTVALSGDGGDEAFAGYMRYVGVPLAHRTSGMARSAMSMMPLYLRRRLRGFQGRNSLARRVWWLMHVSSPRGGLGAIYDRSMGHQDGVDDIGLWAPPRREYVHPPESYRHVIDPLRRHGPLAAMTAADYAIYLPDDTLMKVDRASMAHGLEVRSPFLDHRLVEAMALLPADARMPGGRRKALLRNMADRVLPPGHGDKPKRGFGVPLDRDMRGPLGDLAARTLLHGHLQRDGFLHSPAVAEVLRLHRSREANVGERIWTLLCLELWYRTYILPSSPPEGPIAWEELA